MKEKIYGLLNDAVQAGNIPGAVIQVMKDGEVVLKEAVGYRVKTENELQPMTTDTIFDVASLTKVMSTLPAILKLIDDGVLALSDPAYHYIPELNNQNKDQIRLYHLLTHTAGFNPFHNFFEENLSKEEIMNRIYVDTLNAKPGEEVVYSDLGYMLLSKIVEVASGQPFEIFTEKKIFTPLQMKETGFNPTFPKEHYAATEYDPKIDTYKLGVVHDENAEALGGVSGHAGLFSSISDIGHYVSMIEKNGVFNDQAILSQQAVELSRKNFTPFGGDFRGLGWQLKKGSLTSCGDYFSDEAYGHTGFTGTSIWFDPTIDLNVILLTNRVHFGREPDVTSLRARIHNVIRQYY